MSEIKENECENFSWKKIYKEIANKIVVKENKPNLIEILGQCSDFKPIPSNNKTINDVIDYFTFFASFNRGISFENRLRQLKIIADALKIDTKIPSDFNGIPVVNNINGRFSRNESKEDTNNIENLNELFGLVLSYPDSNSSDCIGNIFNKCLNITGVGISKLTMGLFWINPDNFLPIAGPVKEWIEKSTEKKVEKITDWESYVSILSEIKEKNLDIAKISFESFLSQNDIDGILNKLQDNKKPKNIILTGIPGTGKTYTIMKYLEDNYNKEQYEFVQFHPSYDYEDFIEGLKPMPSENGQIEFKLVNGVFKELCKKAYKDKEKTYVMVIDEINRANLSRVFGELLYCLEYRNKFVSTKMTTYIQGLPDDKPKKYSVNEDNIGKFAIPKNVIILGTMNEVDRSIDAFDLALRRRFIWEDIGFSESNFMGFIGFCTEGFSQHRVDLLEKANKLNKKLSEDIGVNYQLGHTYYYKIMDYYNNSFDNALCDLWEYHIKSIVREYCKIKFGENEIHDKLSEYKKIIVGENNCNG